ncbi:putative MFS-type transporter [Candidatus Syntrophocurvum alkaliphilum]|uniref:Putative MFS-type transporter n=1 Tax=Candidatus Syntrophocurvum alkaliphilum TaxID=2293317 RepID=A0A6I6DAY8_9FIRM|nr:MFS transporter [Candidatus Syntrophocurvum alkaliphilum]QGT98635.1 putative MFS-type transporter [Candidatus Syntrophocurvum alkaliphilum]
MFKKTIKNQEVPVQGGFYYGWVIVVFSAVAFFLSGPGQTYSISIFIDSYIEQFGWSRSTVSTYYSLATLAAGLLIGFLGRFLDIYGHRYVTSIVLFLLALTCFFNSLVAGPIMLFIGFFMLRLLGQSSLTVIPNTLVPQWFITKRGRAFSFLAIGSFVSSAMFPIINVYLIQNYDWQIAWIFWGLFVLAFLPLWFYFVRNKPEDIGLLPDNATNSNETSSADKVEKVIKEVNWTLKEAIKTRAFWLLLFCASIPPLINTGITFHFISILSEKGITAQSAAFILSLMSLVGFPVSIAAGFIAEKIKVHFMLVFVFFMEFLVISTLVFTNSLNMAIVFAIVWGISVGFERIVLNIIWPNYFGRENLGSIRGIAMSATVIGAALGPLPFAIAYDYVFGGYTEFLIMLLTLPVIGMICAFLAPRPKKN